MKLVSDILNFAWFIFGCCACAAEVREEKTQGCCHVGHWTRTLFHSLWKQASHSSASLLTKAEGSEVLWTRMKPKQARTSKRREGQSMWETNSNRGQVESWEWSDLLVLLGNTVTMSSFWVVRLALRCSFHSRFDLTWGNGPSVSGSCQTGTYVILRVVVMVTQLHKHTSKHTSHDCHMWAQSMQPLWWLEP